MTKIRRPLSHILPCKEFGASVVGVFLAVEEVVAVEHDEVEVALVERIVTPGHVHALGVFLVGVAVHVMVADDVVLATGKAVPQVAICGSTAVGRSEKGQK